MKPNKRQNGFESVWMRFTSSNMLPRRIFDGKGYEYCERATTPELSLSPDLLPLGNFASCGGPGSL